MLEFIPSPLLMSIILLVVSLAILRRKDRSLSYLLCFSAFWVYFSLVVSMTLFPIPLPESGVEIVPRQSAIYILSHINLIPFDYGQFANLDPVFVIYREIFLNIVLTMPFGFGISFITRFKTKNVLYLALAVGIGIETVQLAMCLILGSLYRGVDINDSLMNAIGVLFGYGLFRVFAWLYVSMTRRLKIKPKGLFAYVHTVASQV